MHKKTYLLSLFLFLIGMIPASAQELSIESRMAFEGETIDSYKQDDNTGFRGRYLQLNFVGDVGESLHFRYQQGLNKTTDKTFFDATNVFDIAWDITDKLTVSGGKQVVAIGGFEYQRPPIKVYNFSEFANCIACFQMGASVTYNFNSNNNLTLQVCNSPLRQWAGNNKYALNLYWEGRPFDMWETKYSVNMMQNTNDRWFNYIMLGNKVNITDDIYVECDIMNRAGSKQTFLLKDWSAIVEASVSPVDRMRCFAKYTYDQNTSGTFQDMLVFNGTEISSATLGMEYAPLKDHEKALTAFAQCTYCFGKNGKSATPVLQDKQMRIQLGFVAHLDILKTIKNYIKK